MKKYVIKYKGQYMVTPPYWADAGQWTKNPLEATIINDLDFYRKYFKFLEIHEATPDQINAYNSRLSHIRSFSEQTRLMLPEPLSWLDKLWNKIRF